MITIPGGSLLLQCKPTEIHDAVPVAARPGAGIVVTVSTPSARAVLAIAENLLSTLGFSGSVLLDANRYSGKSRRRASDDFDYDWISRQRRLGMTILTDSGYIGEGDREGLRSILSRSKVIGDVVAVLPLHLSWVRDRDGQRILLDEVQGHGVPVALVLEHDSDPLGVQAAVAGLLQLLRLDVPVFLLRSDVSAIGALCFGAHGAAVGSRTSLRHLYPLRDSSGGRPARIAAVVPDCLTFRSLDTIALAVAADPDNTVWTCRCNTCLQRSLDWLATLNDDELASRKAFSHSAEILFDLRDSLLGDQVPLQERGDSWVETCQYAQVRNLEIAETTPKWDVPKFLGSWVAKAPVHPRTSDGTSLSDNSRRS